MQPMTLEDTHLIQKARELRRCGMFVSDIAKQLSKDSGIKITKMALWRLFNSIKEETEEELLETDYPSLEDYSHLFNKKVQREKNSTRLNHDGITIRRDLMIRILTNYYSKKFTYTEVKNECNDRDGDQNFRAHWDYLLKYHFIEKVDDYKFKFCDRVREWKTFNKR